jgi:magnesium-transporting ATPase (P-type)
LTDARIKCVMITGDNLLTGVSVARDCGMVPRGDRVVILEEKSEASVQYHCGFKLFH